MTDVMSVKFRCVFVACSVAWLAVRPGDGGVGGAVDKERGGGGGDRRDTWEGRACCQPAGPLNPTALGKGCVCVCLGMCVCERECVDCVCLAEICQF